MSTFTATIHIIGINPYVLLPMPVLQQLFEQAGKDKGAIPVRIEVGGQSFVQNLVKYSGEWRLYLNTPMRKAAQKDVGDDIEIGIAYDPVERKEPVHPKLLEALSANEAARMAFDQLSPSRQKEIVRYINALKREETVQANVEKAIGFLLGEKRFVGRNKP